LRRVLLPFVFVLFLMFQTLNMQWCAGIENASSLPTDPSENVREVEIKQNNSREIYRDGIIDNFDNFTNQGFPTEHNRFCFHYG
jgi:hypothetical protein